MAVRTKVTIVFITIYSLYCGYVHAVRLRTIARRRTLAADARYGSSATDLELYSNAASPTEQFSVLVIAGRFVNPFPEYRDQSFLEHIVWKITSLAHRGPHAGIPYDKSKLADLLPIYRPDFEVLFDVISITNAATNATITAAASNNGEDDLSLSISSAVYYSSDTGSSTNLQLDSNSLLESWTAVPPRNTSSLENSPISESPPALLPQLPLQQQQQQRQSPASESSVIAVPLLSNASSEHLNASLGIPSKQDRLTVTWLGQSCAFIQCGDLNFLTDPLFGNHIVHSFLGPKRILQSPCQLEHLPKIDYVLVSHDHPDHLELETVRAIGNSAVWIVPLGVRKFLARQGIYRVTEMTWWQKLSLGDDGWEVACTPAMHWSGRGLFGSNQTLWCSFLILHDSKPVVFHAGDSGYSPELFAGIAEVYGTGCQVALVPCGAYDPRWHLRSQHCDPAEAVQIMADLQARRLIGVHWGTFAITDEHFLEPKHKLESIAQEKGQSNNIWAAQFGQTVVIRISSGTVDGQHVVNLGSDVATRQLVQGRDTLLW
ncbi:beta-lactamase superfamily domain-containing protein [Lipomyces japonicus]|uniref:beta-lactamase superfamily domain-containing protein n=1 Tax=Lipomyces japonicus TaxID=56871 RepID=UPI0034CFEB04